MPRIHWTWVFAALLVAVSLSSVSFQLVNGAVVSTEPEVRLRQGFRGLVPCTVIRKISTVSWKKGDVVENAVDVVTLDISNGHISGQGFEDGEFTVASNYSLIFENALSKDSGRYFCEVTDYGTGSKYRNQSDVTVFDPPVITDASRVLQYGDQAILRCQYEEAIYIVQWKKGRTKDDSEVLVQIVLDRDSNRTQREFPPGYQGWYNMTDNFSLVINSTRIQDGGRYFCLVSDLATSIILSNSTYVYVVATPKEAFPEINTCMPISTNGSVQTCEICEDRNTTITLTCTVTGYYPNISLSFSDASNMTSMTKRNISNDSEGLLTQVVTIELFVGTEEMCGTSLVRANPVTCTASMASGLPFGTTRTTQGVFTPTETKGNQTDRNDAVAICVQDSSTCRHPPVITDDRRVLQYGKMENLTCQYEKPVCAIYWMKGDTCADAEQLVELNLYHEISYREGLGYDQGWYNISEDCSLVINSTRIQDRGWYFCVVSDRATGRRIVNSTYVDVVATPQEKFPEIDTCVQISSNESMQTCNISADSNTTISLTCTVTGYYPNVSLSFNDTSNQARVIQRTISTDTEGLLTQVVTIELLVGSDPVKCTASVLPFGTTITTLGVFILTRTSGNQTDANNSGAAVAAGVSVTVISSIMAVAVYFVYWKYFRQRGLRVSFVELWHLVSEGDQQADFLVKAIEELTGDVVTATGMNTKSESMYSLLCKWKDGYQGQNQLGDLFQCLRNHGLKKEVARLKAFRKNATKRIPTNMIKILVWEIGNPKKIKEIMENLDTPKQIDISQQMNDQFEHFEMHGTNIYLDAIACLNSWDQESSKMNPLVLLNLAMEDTKCSPTDRNFFKDDGPISYVELWELANFRSETDYLMKVRTLCGMLQDDQVAHHDLGETPLTANDVYLALCQWKQQEHDESSREHQKDLLLAVLRADGLTEAAEHLEDFRAKVVRISNSTIRRLIRGIRGISDAMDPTRVHEDTNKEDALMQALKDNGDIDPKNDGNGMSSDSDAIKFLQRWSRRGSHNRNPLVSLCLAAECAECNPVDREFFIGRHPVSLVELWYLASERGLQTDSLLKAINALREKDPEAGIGTTTPQRANVYFELRDWKTKYQGQNQLEDLFTCLRDFKLQDKVDRLQKFRNYTSEKIPSYVFNKFILEIADRRKIKEVFENLDIPQSSVDQLDNCETNFNHHAINCLTAWNEGNSCANRLVLLDLAMEDAECSPVARNFFKDFDFESCKCIYSRGSRPEHPPILFDESSEERE